MGSVKRAVKKIARPKVLLPLAALAIGGPMASKAIAAKGGLGAALTGLKGAALKGAAAKGSLMGSGAVTSALAPNVGIGAALKAAPALAGNVEAIPFPNKAPPAAVPFIAPARAGPPKAIAAKGNNTFGLAIFFTALLIDPIIDDTL